MYKEALENVSAYNSRLRYERRLRIPFIDAQTGIAMNNCHLWISKLERRAGQTPHYIYSYPARRWRKKKRPPPTERPIEVKVVGEAEGNDAKALSINKCRCRCKVRGLGATVRCVAVNHLTKEIQLQNTQPPFSLLFYKYSTSG